MFFLIRVKLIICVFLFFLIPFESKCEFGRDSFEHELMTVKELEFFESNTNSELTLALCYYKIGLTHYLGARYFDCLEYLLRSKAILEDNNLQHYQVYTNVCDKIGHAFFFFEDYENALIYLNLWNKHANKNTYKRQNVYNTLGLIHSRLGDLDSSNYFFDLALDLAYREEMKDWIGLVSGNKAFNLVKLGDFDQAIDLYHVDLQYSKESGNFISAANVSISLSHFYAGENQWDSVSRYLDLSEELFLQAKQTPNVNFYRVRSEYFSKQGAFKESLENNIRATQLRDSLQKVKDKSDIKSIEFRLFAESKQQEIQDLNQQNDKALRINWIVISAFVIFVIFISIFIKQEKHKYRQSQSIAEYRSKLVQQELKNTKESLSALTQSMNKEVIKSLDQDLDVLNTPSESGDQLSRKQLLFGKLQDCTLLTEDDWINFKRIFIQLHPSYLDNLLRLNNTLTNAEIRHAFLLRLNFSNLEMAGILGISVDSVRRNNLRLRNRLKLKSHDQLIDVLFSIETEL